MKRHLLASTTRGCALLALVALAIAHAPTVFAAHSSLRRGLMVSTTAPVGRRSTLPGLESTLAAQLQRPHVGVAPGDTPVVLHFALNHDDADTAAELVRRAATAVRQVVGGTRCCSAVARNTVFLGVNLRRIGGSGTPTRQGRKRKGST